MKPAARTAARSRIERSNGMRTGASGSLARAVRTHCAYSETLAPKFAARIHQHDQHAEALQVLRNDRGAGHDAEELHHQPEP